MSESLHRGVVLEAGRALWMSRTAAHAGALALLRAEGAGRRLLCVEQVGSGAPGP